MIQRDLSVLDIKNTSHTDDAKVNFESRNEWYVRSPIQKLAVKATLVSQTDDDWYRLEVCKLDETGQPSTVVYPLKTNRLIKNIGDVKFSRDGLIIVASEYDGSVHVWRRGPSGNFGDVGQILSVGSAIYGLEVSESGTSFSVRRHSGGIRSWRFEPKVGEFVLSESSVKDK